LAEFTVMSGPFAHRSEIKKAAYTCVQTAPGGTPTALTYLF
jgi:hypothetical protein